MNEIAATIHLRLTPIHAQPVLSLPLFEQLEDAIIETYPPVLHIGEGNYQLSFLVELDDVHVESVKNA